MTFVSHVVSQLACSVCGRPYEAGKIHALCECGGPLLVRYDLEKVRATWKRESLASAPVSMWRYAPLLPVRDSKHIVSLGEGMTPLLKTARLGASLGANDLWVKDEGVNPTGSFKARGMSAAISMAREPGSQVIAKRALLSRLANSTNSFNVSFKTHPAGSVYVGSMSPMVGGELRRLRERAKLNPGTAFVQGRSFAPLH